MIISIRRAERKDTGLIYRLICELADYEKLRNDVTATPEILEKSLFERFDAEALIAESDGNPIGFALYFHNFSTFKGKACLYLEDIFVLKEFRGLGAGKALFKELVKIADERDCERLDWSVLDWNEPSKEFYKSIGATEMSDWRIFRLTKEKFKKLN